MKKVLLILTLLLCLFSVPVMAADLPDYSGRSHVQNIGWSDTASDANHHLIIGTMGRSLRLEAFSLATNYPDLGIQYQSHVQDIGWQAPAADGQQSGTTGQAKKIEAVKIQLTGNAAPNFNLYYRTHVENYGWLDWTTGFGASGTTGHNFRCEAIEVVIFPKEAGAPGEAITPAVQAIGSKEARFMYLVNKLRKSHGLNYLTGDPNLQAVANVRLDEITRKFSHTRPNGLSFETAVRTAFPNYRLEGGGFVENIGFGRLSMADPTEAYLNYMTYGHDVDRLMMESARYICWVGKTSGTMGYTVTLISGLPRIDFAD